MDEYIKCPKCGCHDLDYWKEEIVTKYYRIKNNGDICGKPYRTKDIDNNEAYGYVCNKCGCTWNGHSNMIIN